MSEEILEQARNLPFDFKTGGDWLIDALTDTGYGGGNYLPDGTLRVWTGGWSECESIICEAMDSTWGIRWWSVSKRGGGFIFGDPALSAPDAVREIVEECEVDEAVCRISAMLAMKDAQITALSAPDAVREIVDKVRAKAQVRSNFLISTEEAASLITAHVAKETAALTAKVERREKLLDDWGHCFEGGRCTLTYGDMLRKRAALADEEVKP
jgi:hypothetical protein